MPDNSDKRLHIADEGTDCPVFVAKKTFDGTPDKAIHTARLVDPMAHVKTGETATVIRMLVDEDGGIVTYDDGVTIYRRVFDDLETAVDVFRGTVDETVEEYERKGGKFEFGYDGGNEPVEFETQK